MINNPTLLKRVLNLLIVILVVINGFIVVLYLRNKQALSTHVSAKIAQNINFPYQANNDSIYFYTGSSLASLDTISFKTSLLSSPGLVLPADIASLEFSEHGAALITNSTSINDDLGLSALKMGYSSASSYLWYVPFHSDKPLFIGMYVNNYYIDETSSSIYYVVSSQEGDYSLLRYDIKSAKSTFIQGLATNSRVVYANATNFYLLSGTGKSTNLVKEDLSGMNAQTILSNPFNSDDATSNNQLVMTSSGVVIFIKNSGQTESLVSFNIDSNKSKTLVSSFTGTISSGHNYMLASNLRQKAITFTSVNNATGRADSLSIIWPNNSVQSAFKVASSIYFVDNRGDIYIASKTALPNGTPSVKKVVLPSQLGCAGSCFVYPDSGGFLVTVTSGPYPEQIGSFRTAVEGLGYDPNQINFSFQAGNAVAR